MSAEACIHARGGLPQHCEWATKNGGGGDVPGVSSTWGHEAGGTEPHGSPGPRGSLTRVVRRCAIHGVTALREPSSVGGIPHQKEVATLLGKSSMNRAPSDVTTDRVPAGPSGPAAAGARPTACPRARRSPGPHASPSPSGAAGGGCALTPGPDSDGDQSAGSLARGCSRHPPAAHTGL